MLVEFLARLAQARLELQSVADDRHELQKKYEETPEYLALNDRAVKAKATADELDELIRKMSLQQFMIDKNKHPLHGVELTEVEEFEYDPALAREWCYKNFPLCLKLDVAQFDKTLRALDQYETKIPFVTVKKVTKVKLGRDLNEYLPKLIFPSDDALEPGGVKS